MCPQDIQPFPDMPVSECGSQASEERGQHPVSIVVVSPLHSFLSQIWRPHTKLHTPPFPVYTPGSAGTEQPPVLEVNGFLDGP